MRERVKAKVAGLKEKLLAIKEKRAVEKTAKANEKAGVVTAPAPAVEAATATGHGNSNRSRATPAAPVAATPAPAPAAAPTKQEKKRMTLDQVRKRLLCFHSHFSKEEEDDSEPNVEPRIAENSTRGSQGPREAGSRSSNSNGTTIPNININDQPITTTTQDPVIATGLPNPEHHGTDPGGQGDNTSSGTSIGRSGRQTTVEAGDEALAPQ
ncbi:hypothetical protein DID88_009113 [Monilinia fructigena]|uniref:Uncharacterized protein n=1 Tax=Monilinia fructigena TaxID=38457 RepID=A0A395IHH6_9HELO|nr:hypothetical protein DID88_009113 [Monilinia fructigena]